MIFIRVGSDRNSYMTVSQAMVGGSTHNWLIVDDMPETIERPRWPGYTTRLPFQSVVVFPSTYLHRTQEPVIEEVIPT